MIVNSAKGFGALIRSERRKRGWSQKELASIAGVSPLWISQIERGKPTAHIGLVLQTLRALDVKLWVGAQPTGVRKKPIDLDALVDPNTGTIDRLAAMDHYDEQKAELLRRAKLSE